MNKIREIAEDGRPSSGSQVPPDWLPDASLAEKLMFVAEARATFGGEAGRLAWAMVGLPSVIGSEVQVALLPIEQVVDRWLEERTERAALAKSSQADLYGDYVTWASERASPPASVVTFSRRLAIAGVQKVKASTIFYLGVRLKGSADD